ELRIMVAQVVGNVNFPVLPQETSVRIQDAGGIEIFFARFFEEGGDDDDAEFLRAFRQRLDAPAGEGFREGEKSVVVDLAKVARSEQLLKADDLRSRELGFLDFDESLLQIFLGIRLAAHLNQAQDHFSRITIHINLISFSFALGLCQKSPWEGRIKN